MEAPEHSGTVPAEGRGETDDPPASSAARDVPEERGGEPEEPRSSLGAPVVDRVDELPERVLDEVTETLGASDVPPERMSGEELWATLPQELQRQIVGHLSRADMAHLSESSREMYRSVHPEFLRDIGHKLKEKYLASMPEEVRAAQESGSDVHMVDHVSVRVRTQDGQQVVIERGVLEWKKVLGSRNVAVYCDRIPGGLSRDDRVDVYVGDKEDKRLLIENARYVKTTDVYDKTDKEGTHFRCLFDLSEATVDPSVTSS